MTIDDFIQELPDITSHFHWNADEKGAIRAAGFCPLTAMAKVKFNKDYLLSHFIEAAVYLGVSFEDSQKIAAAADLKKNEWFTAALRLQLEIVLLSH